MVRSDISYFNQLRARYTRLILGINRDARPKTRLKELEMYNDSATPNIDDFSYRFFINR